jgi:hypothetical protein
MKITLKALHKMLLAVFPLKHFSFDGSPQGELYFWADGTVESGQGFLCYSIETDEITLISNTWKPKIEEFLRSIGNKTKEQQELFSDADFAEYQKHNCLGTDI